MIARIALFLLLSAATQAADLSIVRVFTGWREAASFKRISEYFNGRENSGGEAIARTQPGERSGYYYLVRVANPAPPRAIKARLQVVTDLKTEPTTHEFPVELKSGDTVFHLGLTGSDWTDASHHPVAWKLDLTDSEGRVLASETSYLWARPAN